MPVKEKKLNAAQLWSSPAQSDADKLFYALTKWPTFSPCFKSRGLEISRQGPDKILIRTPSGHILIRKTKLNARSQEARNLEVYCGTRKEPRYKQLTDIFQIWSHFDDGPVPVLWPDIGDPPSSPKFEGYSESFVLYGTAIKAKSDAKEAVERHYLVHEQNRRKGVIEKVMKLLADASLRSYFPRFAAAVDRKVRMSTIGYGLYADHNNHVFRDRSELRTSGDAHISEVLELLTVFQHRVNVTEALFFVDKPYILSLCGNAYGTLWATKNITPKPIIVSGPTASSGMAFNPEIEPFRAGFNSDDWRTSLAAHRNFEMAFVGDRAYHEWHQPIGVFRGVPPDQIAEKIIDAFLVEEL